MRIFFLLFILTYTIGLYLIVRGPHTLFFEGNPSLVQQGLINSTIFFLLLMSYISVLIYVCPEQLRNPEVVDSPYFLGFVFTLTSLVVAFHDVSSLEGIISSRQGQVNAGTDNVNIEAFLDAPTVIISQAGIALTTSIIGIILRLFLIANFGESENLHDVVSEQKLEILEKAYFIAYGIFCLIYVFFLFAIAVDFAINLYSTWFG